MSPIRVEQGEVGDLSAMASDGADSPLAPCILAAGRRLVAQYEAGVAPARAGVDIPRSIRLLSSVLLADPSSFNPDAHTPEELATLRGLLDELCVETLQGDAGASLAPALFVAAADIFARVRRLLQSREDADFSSLLAPDGSDLVVELAHDLRSPLTSILFLSETLRRGQSGDVNEYQRRQLGIIYSAALGLISMASDVIELARGGEQLLEREPTAFSVGEILDSVCDMVAPMAEENSNTLRVLPPSVDRRLGYPVAISRVLLNLTTNALKFTERGFVEMVAKEVGHSSIEFSVRDAGRGMDEEEVANLFQPFHRMRSSNRYGFSGSGLGLTICRNLVRAMGSELEFETTKGWGTRFHFEVKLPPVSPI